jgi:hypothetical protein
MKWRIIKKNPSQTPSTGSYSDWKPQLAKEANFQCVYCCIHEANFGGIRNFHVEHLKPQSKFPTLINSYSNLFYACGVCNVFKSNDWPNDLAGDDFSKAGYPDPSQVDYNEFIEINSHNGSLTSKSPAGKYVIERLHLNRPHLVSLRAWTKLIERLKNINTEITEIINTGATPTETDAIIQTLLSINTLLFKLNNSRPYSPDQLR